MNRLQDSMDLPERCCEQGLTKLVETEQSDRHGRQGKRIRERNRPVCWSSCLLESKVFVLRARSFW